VKDVAVIEDGNSGWTRQINDQIVGQRDEARRPAFGHSSWPDFAASLMQMGFNGLRQQS
jgi:hypothetical protein